MIQANIRGTIRGRAPKKQPAFGRSTFYAPNVLARDFTPREPDRAWAADITYLPIRGRWLYLAVVIDLFSRRVVGWATATDQGAVLAIRALRMALRNRRPQPGLIHHSDRGTQYTAESYRKILADRAIVVSMSRTRECWDNAVAESFFGSLKAELMPRSGWHDRESAELAIGDYIEIFYNHQRRHTHNGYLSPVAAERSYREVA
jgi:transposase InsO family protein